MSIKTFDDQSGIASRRILRKCAAKGTEVFRGTSCRKRNL